MGAGILWSLTKRCWGRLVARGGDAVHDWHPSARLQDIAVAASEIDIWELYLPTGILTVSGRWSSLVGNGGLVKAPVDELIRKYVHPDDLQQVEGERLAYRSGQVPHYISQFRICLPNGETRWLQARGGATERDRDGLVVRLAGILLDVTDRHRAQERLRLALANASSDIFEWEVRHGWFTMGPRWAQELGIPVEGMPAQTPRDFLSLFVCPDDLERVVESSTAHLKAGVPYHEEHRVCATDGRILWVAVHGVVAEKDQQGKPIRITGAIQDITQLKQTEEALREREKTLAMALDASRTSMFRFDERTGRLQFSAPIGPRIGIDEAEVPTTWSQVLARFVHPEDRKKVEEIGLFTSSPAEPMIVTLRVIYRDGEVGWVEMAGRLEIVSGSRVLTGTARDVTERELVTQELEEALRHVQSSSEQMQHVLSLVAHDLRTPLGAILVASRSLQAGTSEGTTDTIRQQAGVMATAAGRMKDLIDDLLDASTLEAGGLVLDLMPVDPIAVAMSAVDLAQPLAKERDVVLLHERDPATPLEVRLDRARMLQVLDNLIANALRATDRGGMVRVKTAPAPGAVSFEVRDSGRGIAPDDLKHLFEPYWRSSSASYQGSGLGLAIARGLVELHGGRIYVESREGVGSTFTVQVPISGGGESRGAG